VTTQASPLPAGASAQPLGCTSFKLRQLGRVVGQHHDSEIGLCGLKTTQYSLLSQLLHLGAVRPGELAVAMRLDASTLTRNLKPLLAAGWVQLEAGADGRSRRLSITAEGRAKRAEAQRHWKLAQQDLNRKLGPQRVQALHALIDQCLQLLDAADEA
jgi:DNA-binding MarR family transcriptional regulator